MWAKVIDGEFDSLISLEGQAILSDGKQLGKGGFRVWSEDGAAGLAKLKAENIFPVTEHVPSHDTETEFIESYTYTARENDVLQIAVVKTNPVVEKSLIQKGITTQFGFELTDAIITDLNKPGNELLAKIFLGDK